MTGIKKAFFATSAAMAPGVVWFYGNLLLDWRYVRKMELTDKDYSP